MKLLIPGTLAAFVAAGGITWLTMSDTDIRNMYVNKTGIIPLSRDLFAEKKKDSAQSEVTQTSTTNTTKRAHKVNEPSIEDILLSEVQKAKQCYQSPSSCDFADDDPRMETIQAGQNYQVSLMELQQAMHAGDIDEDTARDYSLEALTLTTDGHVQSAALDILANIEPSTDTIEPLLSVIGDTHNARIAASAIQVLNKQPIDGYQENIDSTLQKALKTSSINVSPTIAKSILPYISDNNVDNYVDLLLELDGREQTQKTLDLKLAEYSLMQVGG